MPETLFSLVAGGVSKIRRVAFPTIEGTVVKCGIRILLDADDDAIETAARAAAEARGVKEPKPGDPIYDRWVRLFTLLFATVAVPEEEGAPVPPDAPLFFDGGVEQIQHHLDRERIAYLFAMQEQWQALIAPRRKNLSRDEFIQAIFQHAMATTGEDELPFWRWHPALQESYLVSTAALLMRSPSIKSAYGSDSAAPSTGSSPSEAGGNQPSRDDAFRDIDTAIEQGDARAAGIGAGPEAPVRVDDHAGGAKEPAPGPQRRAGPARAKKRAARRR